MNDAELKQFIADQVREAVAEKFKSRREAVIIDITPTETSIRWIAPGKRAKYYRVKVTEAT